jgi:H+/gluconate symporter-like permease
MDFLIILLAVLLPGPTLIALGAFSFTMDSLPGALAQREGYGVHTLNEPDQRSAGALPNPWIAVLPLGMVASRFAAVITLLAVTGLTHRDSYRDIFAVTCLKTLAVFVVIAVYLLTGIY